ncbi:MAG: hypothetical protein LBU51_11100, partial [Bacteroidales bacterium]|nr:hypothetical protein [Bacteroidales bacterium]
VEITGIPSEISELIKEAINSKLSAFQIDETGKSKIATTTITSFSTEDGGEFRFGDGLHWYDWGPVLCDAGSSIWESSRLPETYWNQSNPKYKDYPLHAPPTFTGVADGAIEEITGTAQLVKLGLEITTDKEKATALWESIKNINFSTIKEAATGAVKEKWDKYANSPDYITSHEIGKDGVQIASLLYGGFAAKGKKLSEAVEESGNVIGKRIRKFTQKEIDDYVKLATKNPDAKKVMLGRYIKDDPSSYHIRADREGYTYFQLDDWDNVEKLVSKNADEMWRINKQFLDEQKALNKEFYFSHNLWEYEAPSFRSSEAEYLIDLGAKDFIQINENTWKVIWK